MVVTRAIKKYSRPKSRLEVIEKACPDLPKYRHHQLLSAWFDSKLQGYESVSTMPKVLREKLEAILPWLSLSQVEVLSNKDKDTYKALLKTADNLLFESVLMKNSRGYWTICLSSQVGCAMGCTFCATGKMGLKRSLNSDEIVDQLRFWQNFLQQKKLDGQISNLVFMGMGEPLANYEEVKTAIIQILKYTNIGSNRITVSTVGLLPQLQKILGDPDWPKVRLAISLHSADNNIRKNIMKATTPLFHQDLADWTHLYQRKIGSKNNYLTFEYVLLAGINDQEKDARQLAKYMAKTSAKKINLICYNENSSRKFSSSQMEIKDNFKKIIRSYGLNITERKSLGQDIKAACGMLATQ